MFIYIYREMDTNVYRTMNALMHINQTILVHMNSNRAFALETRLATFDSSCESPAVNWLLRNKPTLRAKLLAG